MPKDDLYPSGFPKHNDYTLNSTSFWKAIEDGTRYVNATGYASDYRWGDYRIHISLQEPYEDGHVRTSGGIVISIERKP
jgi:hypothetical protein